jgi:hypothetical protein
MYGPRPVPPCPPTCWLLTSLMNRLSWFLYASWKVLSLLSYEGGAAVMNLGHAYEKSSSYEDSSPLVSRCGQKEGGGRCAAHGGMLERLQLVLERLQVVLERPAATSLHLR